MSFLLLQNPLNFNLAIFLIQKGNEKCMLLSKIMTIIDAEPLSYLYPYSTIICMEKVRVTSLNA